MSGYNILSPYTMFNDLDGKPLTDGYIYIGTTNQNPETNPLGVFWDAAMTIPASQPIRTAGGYPVRNGSPAQIYVAASNHSTTIRNKKKALVYYSASVAGMFSFDQVGGALDASVVSYLPPGVGAGSRTVDDRFLEEVSVFDFIPQSEHAAIIAGSSVYNATDDFYDASKRIQTLGGGKLVVPSGLYNVGKQTFAGATGMGYAYKASPIISISNCANPVVIEFRGAKMKLVSGLKFGSFNPTTGDVYAPGGLPFSNQDYGADVGVMCSLVGNKSVAIVGSCEMDGNIQNVVLGGQWGDNGYQRNGYGINAYTNDNLSIENVYTHHHCTDGVVISYTGLVEGDTAKPAFMRNVISEYNARQGFSWIGGNQLVAISCKFNHTGKSSFSSSPGSGIDIESESTVIRNGVFINCEMVNNTGSGMVADTGDTAGVTFIRCKFVGTTSYAIWPRKPRFSFRDCLIVGSSVNSYGDATYPDNATKFFNCKFTDEVEYGYGGVTFSSGSLLFDGSVATNVLFDTCTFIATKQKLANLTNSLVYDTTFIQKAGTESGIADSDFILIVWASILRNITVIDQITNVPVNGYYVSFSGNEKYSGINYLKSTGKIKWFSWSSSAGGYTGYLGQDNANLAPQTYLALGKTMGNRLIGYYGQMKIVAWNAAPTTGTWAVGDQCINSAPVVGQPKGWRCTVAGTPGTWVSEGNL